MDESSNSSLGSSSGTPPTGNGVPGGGDSGFHPQQMQHQQFGAAYRPGKFQTPLGLHQQRPVMISYDQHSVPQQQGSYMHHGPYQQLLHQQQQLQFQQQQQQQQQQLHQQLQMQFPQQPENLQRSMPFIQDTQKSSSSQNQSQNLKSSNVETTNKGSSSNPSTAAVKPDSSTDDGTTKEPTQTPAEVEKLTKELESQRTAHEKQVKDLEALIASLQEQKKEKEVKYLRVGSSGPQKKKQEETSPKRKSTRSKSALNNSGDEDMDTGGDAGDIMDSCPSPVPSNVSIKEEPDDDDEYEKWAVQGIKFPRVLDEDGDTKANLKKETAIRCPKEEHPKTYTLSVTDFDFCIFCQSTHEEKLTHVTEDNFATIQSIILNVDCEPSHRLKDYALDVDMFMNNLPQFHQKCHSKFKCKLRNFRIKRKNSEVTDLSLCIFCQEHKQESLSKITKKGFSGFQNDISELDHEMTEKLKKFFNLERIQIFLNTESAKEEFSPDKLKTHKFCRHKFIKHKKARKSQKSSNFEPVKKETTPYEDNDEENVEITPVEEENVEITPDEEVFELLAKRKKKMEEERQKKLRKELPEPEDFDYKKKCVLCGSSVHHKNKVRSIKDDALQKTKENAIEKEHSDIIKVLEHAEDSGIELLVHCNCYGNYIYKSHIRVKKGTYECYEKAFRPIAVEIEDSIFRNGKVVSVAELKDKFLKTLMEYNVEGDDKMNLFINRIRNYYTFGKKCRVNVISYPYYFIYSNHLRESQVASQIDELKKERENKRNENCPYLEQVPEDMSSSNNDSTNSELKKKKKLRFSCIECGYKCFRKANFNKHLKKHELKSIEEIVISKQAMCDLCGKILKNNESLKTHMRIHSGKKYPCPQCDKSYFSEGALNGHLVIHTGKDEECPECGKKFFGKQHLKKHIKTVHGSGQFLCSVCGKSFRIKERLKDHARKHSDARPYTCKECGKGFKYPSNLRTHEMAHDGKKPYMCSTCSFGCYTKANLNVHMAIHTGKSEQIMSTRNEQVNEEYDSEKYIHLYDDIPNIKAQAFFHL